MTKIFYDTETTGLNYKQHSIWQLAGLIEINGIVVEGFNIKMRPHPKAKVDRSALAAGNITIEELNSFQSQAESLKSFIEIISKYVDPFNITTRAKLVGFNNRRFDDDFLKYFFELNANKLFFGYFWSDSLDALVLASEYLENRRVNMPSFKLKRVALELGLEIDKSALHGAYYDATITYNIYQIVTGRYIEI